ncbi:hypothetical protein TrVE_jg1858 [Triparma verrucosa]|uniref:RecA family profile 1 domain-containing protein n=1 Tax=Triparma verrucosa TaxID=1606542 RepID=A0A9W7CFC2_9STRA|nr:hypothetical protein TrVE_jg1858 [Triparma verrucosa]
MGKCGTCNSWGTLVEEEVRRDVESAAGKPSQFTFNPDNSDGAWLERSAGSRPKSLSTLTSTKTERINLENSELNTVFGGGLTVGSLTLLAGNPGVGKSTLLMQLCDDVAGRGKVLYVTGEENENQIHDRVRRLELDNVHNIEVWAENDGDLVAGCVVDPRPDIGMGPDASKTRYELVVIDSMQTMVCSDGVSKSTGSYATGSVTMVRSVANLMMRLSKGTGTPIILVGHVTKSNSVAGPRTVEHMVDTILILESGENDVRVVRVNKNRFGNADEVGVFQMTNGGDNGRKGGMLVPVTDASRMFMNSRNDEMDIDGCATVVAVEGSRCITVEVQALVVFSAGNGGGKRVVDGVSNQRVQMILAVLDKRYGIRFSKRDVYVNVVGGLKLSGYGSQAAGGGSDLAVAVALVSSLTGIPVRADTAFVGEVGLAGEMRSVRGLERRVAEAKRMGFNRVIVPSKFANTKKGGYVDNKFSGIQVIGCGSLLDAVNGGLVEDVGQNMRWKKKKAGGGRESGMENGTGFPQRMKDLALEEEQEEDDLGIIEDDEFDDEHDDEEEWG